VKVPEASGKRFILINTGLYQNEIARCLHAEFSPEWPVLDGSNDSNKGEFRRWRRTQSEDILGIKYAADIRTVLVDMVKQMIKTGALVK